MKLRLPRNLKGVKFDLLLTIDMNSFDVETLLPSLYHLVRTKGRRVGKPANPEHYEEYIAKLLQHPRIGPGFRTTTGRSVLNRWVRTSVVQMGRQGVAHKGEKILQIRPNTLLAYKAGLPKDVSRLRQVHYFIYRVLIDSFPKDGKQEVDRIFKEALGKGLVLDDDGKYDGRYDGRTPVDIETLLTIAFLDGVTAAGASAQEADLKMGPRLKKQADFIGKDIIGLLRAYPDLPYSVMNEWLLTLINAHLFVYSMRQIQWVIQTTDDPGRKPQKQHEFYMDCTGERGSYSDGLAQACVERDLENLERYIRAGLRLRTLDRFATGIASLTGELPGRNEHTGEYLRELLKVASNPRVEARADHEFDLICHENGLDPAEDTDEREHSDAVEYLQALRESTEHSAVDRLVLALYEAQRGFASADITKWYYSVAGFNRVYGLLSGNAKGRRRVSRYTMSNTLLATLVHLAIAVAADGRRQRLPLKRFLEWLKERFGLLIGDPPQHDKSAEAAEAARGNLESFKHRLRQIGVFENLSDDFDAQYVYVPGRTVPGRD